MSTLSFVFAPLAPPTLLATLSLLTLLILIPAFINRPRGTLARTAFFALLLFTLAGPTLQQQQQEPLPTLALAVVDHSASQSISNRQDQSARALQALKDEAERKGFELHVAETPHNAASTLLLETLSTELLRLNPQQLGAVFLISDGQIHDTQQPPTINAPTHLLLTGSAQDRDRSLRLVHTPRFGLLSKPIHTRISVQSRGTGDESVPVNLRLNGNTIRSLSLKPNTEHTLTLSLANRGKNFIEIETPSLDNEITNANNRVGFVVNGLRDRLRILIVSGHPHAGQRAWRDLLKSDPAVDLVHFNILREREDDVRAEIDELSLIAFPVDQLFLEDLNGFDLILFDRYFLRGHLRQTHLTAIANFVNDGGALLAVAGEEFSSPYTLYNGVLADVMAAEPQSQIIRGAFRPARTELGQRHPVTASLKETEDNPWGHWYRRNLVATRDKEAAVLMRADDDPLLVLTRKGKGRSALLASDQIWLWARGHDNGGPEAALLRRLVHWLMREPELEEEQLLLEAEDDGSLTVERRSLRGTGGVATLTAPDGSVQQITLNPLADDAYGRSVARLTDPQDGFWRATQPFSTPSPETSTDGSTTPSGDAQDTSQEGAGEVLEAFALVGRNLQREFATPFSTPELLRPLINREGGTVVRLEEHPEPRLRRVRGRGTGGGSGDWLAVADKRAVRTLSTEAFRCCQYPWWQLYS